MTPRSNSSLDSVEYIFVYTKQTRDKMKIAIIRNEADIIVYLNIKFSS